MRETDLRDGIIAKLETWILPSRLPRLCKVSSEDLLDDVNEHMAQNMSGAQKGMGNNTRVGKHQLLVDQAVVRDCKTRLTKLCPFWIDYKKACDSMPHTWILEY